MRANLQKRLEQQQQHIDLSPLLDVVFILLIFFIVTTVFVKETGVEVDKPQALSSQKLERNVIMIAITNSGEVIYDNSNITVSGVRNTVSQLLKNRPQPVVIQADKQVPTELLVQVIDESKLAGASSVNIATVL
ncbi:ExbD/TolR family protein [Pseudoalteromonas tunicata]|jgi:biopolymer transport protein ExbD|uniref:Biopolymer transport protein n=1 Tax=Pseudoalteromonas tunicata D2 TaxID=87626 RepID=A4CDZ9_9GAMM|nr:biopolymer transporter ExbD [Pseudoalteromonas tunicata]ATC96316.1 biopolymer transport protein ExbD [Pseudoalteromonas tunicata]AXT31822.1 biopolymer transporter ExbD [Pseudoalteromonas tunicata]EAR27191.1 Biopolymer transport protein [Pseudoalteromonas tunicata D2]MDP4984573.1 biopolymer transporter ExbD [Pseudoalteromonas tunicata]